MLFQVGTEDKWITLALDESGLYAATPAPVCKIIYQGADHFAWTDLRAGFQRPTTADTAAFLKVVFAGGSPTTTILTPLPMAQADCK